MELEYLGDTSFSMKSKTGLVLLTSPWQKQKTDVLIAVGGTDVKPEPVKREDVFVIESEGEYEVGGVGVVVYKFKTDSTIGKNNIMVVVRLDGVNIVFPSSFVSPLSESQLEKLGPVDVVLLPGSEETAISATDIAKFVDDLTPSYVMVTDESIIEKCKWVKSGESLKKIKMDQKSLPDEKQVILMHG